MGLHATGFAAQPPSPIEPPEGGEENEMNMKEIAKFIASSIEVIGDEVKFTPDSSAEAEFDPAWVAGIVRQCSRGRKPDAWTAMLVKSMAWSVVRATSPLNESWRRGCVIHLSETIVSESTNHVRDWLLGPDSGHRIALFDEAIKSGAPDFMSATASAQLAEADNVLRTFLSLIERRAAA